MELKNFIASIEDFPKKGIVFRDVTPLFQNGEAFHHACSLIVEYAKKKGATIIAGPEARGFMIGCPVAAMLKVGFVPVRKPGKLPRAAINEEYSLEYGTNTLSIHADAVKKGDKVLIVDDLLATGGTALATAHLCERLGAEVVGFAFLIHLVDLNGDKLLKGYDIYSLMEYEGE